jgi:hypothetical protein
MSTPDYYQVNAYLEAKTSAGVIDHLEMIARGIEGGAGYCVEIENRGTRAAVLEELSKIETSPLETSYSLISVNDCICYRQDSSCN